MYLNRGSVSHEKEPYINTPGSQLGHTFHQNWRPGVRIQFSLNSDDNRLYVVNFDRPTFYAC